MAEEEKKSKLSFDYKKMMRNVGNVASHYQVIIASVLLLGVFGFVIWRLNNKLDPEMDQQRYDEQITTLKKVKFNEEAISKIQELKDSDVDISSRFVDRDNPFVEN